MTTRKKKKNKQPSALASLLASTGLDVDEYQAPGEEPVRARRGRPARAEAAATRRKEFRVSPAEAQRIERLLRATGGSLSDLVRSLLSAEADRLGIDS